MPLNIICNSSDPTFFFSFLDLPNFQFCFACAVVREERGPYNDPQHHYLYEEDDVWMAPGFINQFYEVS